MAFDLEQRQTAALQEMLQLKRPQASAFGGPYSATAAPWKILVFDEAAKDVLAPLMTVGVLRRFGVTLPLSLSASRTPILEAPAVYLVASMEENVKAIVRDMEKRLYAFYHINFLSGTDMKLLKLLAEGAAKAGVVGSVLSVYDRHVSFVCLSPFEFSLNIPRVFTLTHGAFGDAEVHAAINKSAEGLLSVIATLGVIPVISCPSSSASPARSVGLQLQEMLESLAPKAFTQMFGTAAANSVYRPLLILLDREFDLLTMLQHTWLYGALMHDLLKLRLNRVTVPSSASDRSGSSGAASKTFDLEKDRQDRRRQQMRTAARSSSDKRQQHQELAQSQVDAAAAAAAAAAARDLFWREHAFSPFPVAAAAVSQMLSDYNAELAKVGHGKPDAFAPSGGDFSSDILKAVDALPDLADKKRSLDAHTTIATALVDAIKERELDRFFEVEQGFSQDREAAVTSAARQALAADALGTQEDKLRLLACLYLSRPTYPKAVFESLVSELKQQGLDVGALDFLSKFSAFRSMDFEMQHAAAGPSSTPTTAFEGISSKFLDKGRGLLKGVKNLLVRKSSPIAQLVETFLAGQEAAGYQLLHLRRSQQSSSGASSTTVSPGGPQGRGAPVRQCIVFVLGGASYVEAAALRELAAKTQKQVNFLLLLLLLVRLIELLLPTLSCQW
ncbi:hypothetical protein Emag_005630 [Eimeria magna]